MSGALSVVAIIAAYNEADIIEPVVRDLIANGLLVYFIDDGSTDATVRLVEPYVGRGVINVERVERHPEAGDERVFAWERLLRRKAQLAGELDADWFVHHDADEFRESAWTGVSLLDGIRRVDALGYNAIDFANLDFWPTHDGFTPASDPRDAFPCYSEAATYDRVQVRCWIKTAAVDLTTTGGHDARFDERRVFPIRFISRHYPIRGQAHGERKVFAERRPRFSPKERARSWHVQYDELTEGASFIRDISELTKYDGDAVRMQLALRHRGVEALESSLADAQAALETSHRAAETARCEATSIRDAVARQEGRITELQAELDSRAMELGEAHAQLRHLHGSLHARNLELIDANTQLTQVHTQLTQAHADLGQLQRALDDSQRENAEFRRDIARRTDDAAARERELAARVVELTGTKATLHDVRGRLDAVHRSWSWRLTSPARALLRLLRGC